MPLIEFKTDNPVPELFGIMLYPERSMGVVEKRKCFVEAWQTEVQRAHSLGGDFASLEQYSEFSFEKPLKKDLDKRWWQGTATGEVFKLYFALANSRSRPGLASWKHAKELALESSKVGGEKGSHGSLMDARARFRTCAHLWAAWSIRNREFYQAPDGSYTYADDFRAFLTEAEMLRVWGQNWKQDREKAKAPLQTDVWYMPDDWRPPSRQKGWPQTGGLPDISVFEQELATLRAAGRPKRA